MKINQLKEPSIMPLLKVFLIDKARNLFLEMMSQVIVITLKKYRIVGIIRNKFLNKQKIQ